MKGSFGRATKTHKSYSPEVDGDHLGSTTSVVQRDTGERISYQLYEPWGTTRYSSGDQRTDYAYTGQMKVDDIYYYNARWYDPEIGRFMQADTLVPGHQGTQGWDRYAYVNNNPVNGTDPTGHAGIRDYAMTMTDGGTDYYWETRTYNVEGTLNYARERTYEYYQNSVWGEKLGTPCVIFPLDSMIHGGGLTLYDSMGFKIDTTDPDVLKEDRFIWTTIAGNMLQRQPGAHYQEVNLEKGNVFSASQFKPGDFVIINQENSEYEWGHALLVESVDLANNTVTIIEMGNPSADYDFNRRDFFDVRNKIKGYRIYRMPEYLP